MVRERGLGGGVGMPVQSTIFEVIACGNGACDGPGGSIGNQGRARILPRDMLLRLCVLVGQAGRLPAKYSRVSHPKDKILVHSP